MEDQTNRDMPEDVLPDELRDNWLAADPKPRTIEMTRQADGKWTVTRKYD